MRDRDLLVWPVDLYNADETGNAHNNFQVMKIAHEFGTNADEIFKINSN